MDVKELFYEISLKFNTLKMYENTIEQMEKNGIASYGTIQKVKDEKEAIEKEIEELLKQENIDEENKFLKEVNKPREEIVYEYEDDEYKEEIEKPRLADVQEKISNSKWVSKSNFIFKFPKDEIDIDEWRIAGFNYSLNVSNKTCSCDPFNEEEKELQFGGVLSVIVNDFSEEKEDGTYNILSNTILKLYAEPKIKKYLVADIIDNSGELLYSLVFVGCRFSSHINYNSYFEYKSTDLNSITLQFYFKNLIVLAPNEDLKCDNL